MKFSRFRGRTACMGVLLVGLVAYVGGTSGAALAAKTPQTRTGATKLYSQDPKIAPSSVSIALNAAAIQSPLNSFTYFRYGAKLDKQFNTTLHQDYFSGTSPALAALLSGSAQFAIFSANSQLTADAAGTGSQLVSLMSFGQGGGANLYAATKYEKGYGTGIQAAAKFSKLPVAVPSLTGSGELSLAIPLIADGISLKGVTQLAVGNSTAAALANGQVASDISEATTEQYLVDEGEAYLVFDASGEQAYKATGYLVSSTLMTTRSFIQEYPAFTEALVLDMLKSEQFFISHPTSPKLIYNSFPPSQVVGTSLQSWDAAWPFTRANYQSIDGLVTQANMQHLASYLGQVGILAPGFVLPADSADTSFIDQAYQAEGKRPPTNPMVNSELKWLSKSALGQASG